jgi:hypothetical protein
MNVVVKLTVTRDAYPHETREIEYNLTSDLTFVTAIGELIEAASQSGVCVLNNITTTPAVDEPDVEDESEESDELDESEEPAPPVESGVLGRDYMLIANTRLHIFPNTNDIQHPTREQSRTTHDEFKRILVQLYKEFCLYNDTDQHDDITRLQKMLIAVGVLNNNHAIILRIGANAGTKMSIMTNDITNPSKWDLHLAEGNEIVKVNTNYFLKQLAKMLMTADQYKELKAKKTGASMDIIVEKLDAINKKLKIIKNMGEFNPDAPKVAALQQKYKNWGCN